MKVRNIRKLPPGKLIEVFDITVEDTHLYSVCGILVSNSKRISMLDVNALLAHGSTETLRDVGSVRGQKNENYWLQFMQGYNPTSTKVPFVYEKFVNQLKAAGVNVVRDGHQTNIMALTNKDVNALVGDRLLKHGDTVHFDKDLKPVPGGLFDPQLTGGHGGKNWSYVKLHEPMPSPVMEEPIRHILGLTQKKFHSVIAGDEPYGGFGSGPQAIGKALEHINIDKEINLAKSTFYNGRASARDGALRKWKYLQSAKDSNLHPKDWMLDKVPVLPPAFRPVSIMGDSSIPLVSDPNYLYKEVMTANNNLSQMKEHLGEQGVGPERTALYHAFKAVTGLADPVHPKLQEKGVQGLLASVFGNTPKFSSIQRKLLSSTVDNVGRGTIIPNPDLDLDSVGIPENQAFDVYSKFLVRRLKRRGMSIHEALKQVKDKTDLARETLQEELKERPVYINRAPVLHKFGIMAFNPVLVKGDVIQTNPLINKGFGLDYDGNCCVYSAIINIDIDSSFLYNNDNSPDTLAWKEAIMRLTSASLVIKKEDGIKVALPIGEFPRIGKPKKDRNGANVYEVPDGIRVLSYDIKKGSAVYSKVTHLTVEDMAKCVRVTTKSGRSVEVSNNESLAVFCNESSTLVKRTPKDSLGRLVPVICKHGCFGNKFTDPKLGWWYGVLIADGWVTERTIGYAKNDVVRLCEFTKVLFELFEDAVHPCEYLAGRFDHPNKYGPSHKLHFNSSELVGSVLNIYADKQAGSRSALFKKIPDKLLHGGSRECLLGLLSGLLDGDALVAWPKNRARSKPQFTARLLTSSPSLRDDIGILLTKLGVRYHVTTSPANSIRSEAYTIALSTPSVYDIADELSLINVEAIDALKKLKSQPRPRDGSDIVPVPRKVAERLGKLSYGKSASLYGTSRLAIKTGQMTREAATRIFELDANPDANMLWWYTAIVENRAIFWDVYDEIEKIESQQVFDLAVPTTKVFAIDNGIIIFDTMQFHVPTTDEAVKEAYDRMLPSKSLISPADFKTPMNAPTQEYLGGLYKATKKPDTKLRPRVFRNKKDALEAYQRGDIRAETPVHIIEE